jgi:hypothetical protein
MGHIYLSVRYTATLAAAGVTCSAGTVGDSYDNALAETVNGLFKAELIRRHGPWRDLHHLELAILEWVDWSTTAGSTAGAGMCPLQNTRPRTTMDKRRAPAQPSRNANDQSPTNPGHLIVASPGMPMCSIVCDAGYDLARLAFLVAA